jgi:hypothetical protein
MEEMVVVVFGLGRVLLQPPLPPHPPTAIKNNTIAMENMNVFFFLVSFDRQP